MEYEISVVQWERRPTLVVRFSSLPDDLGARFLEHLPRIADVVIDEGCGLSGAPFARYLGAEGDVLDVEVGLMLTAASAGRGDIGAAELPGGPVAKTVHVGSYKTLGNAHDALRAWMAANGRVQGGPPFELYVSDPSEGDDPAHWHTEVYMLLAP